MGSLLLVSGIDKKIFELLLYLHNGYVVVLVFMVEIIILHRQCDCLSLTLGHSCLSVSLIDLIFCIVIFWGVMCYLERIRGVIRIKLTTPTLRNEAPRHLTLAGFKSLPRLQTLQALLVTLSLLAPRLISIFCNYQLGRP